MTCLSSHGIRCLAEHLRKSITIIDGVRLNSSEPPPLPSAFYLYLADNIYRILGTMANLMVGTSNLPSEIAKAVRAKSVANGPPAGLQHRDSTQSIADAQASSLADVVVKPFHGTPGARDHYRSATVKAIGHDFKNIVAFPREFIQALGKGFHNAPKLYHDRTVRTPDKVTGLKSGLKGAGKVRFSQHFNLARD